MKAVCGWCGKEFEIMTGAYNRAVNKGLKVYCNRKHAGLGRRVNKTKEQRKTEKRIYDKEYRQEMTAELKKKKREWFLKDYAKNPQKYAKLRKQKQAQHNEYCKTPEYRKWKKEYDQAYRAKRIYGDFADAAIALSKLEGELDSRMIKYDFGITQNKSTQKRKRLWKNLQRSI